MSLHIVNFNVSQQAVRKRAAAGELVRLRNGVYADASDDPRALVLTHAARLAKQLFPTAELAAESAILRGAGFDGKIYMVGNGFYRSEIGGVEFVVNRRWHDVPAAAVTMEDAFGTFTVRASQPDTALIEALVAMRVMPPVVVLAALGRIGDILSGSPESSGKVALEDHLVGLAIRMGRPKLCDDLRALVAAHKEDVTMVRNRFGVRWYDDAVGELEHDGADWTWRGRDGWVVPFRSTSSRLPPFLSNLLAEGVLARIRGESDLESMQRGGRFLSNITISPAPQPGEAPPPRVSTDVLLSTLGEHMRADGIGEFSGRFGPTMSGLISSLGADDTCVGVISDLMTNNGMPTVSGAQYKAPVCLRPDGRIEAAINDRPFTHLLKLPPASHRHFEINEWACMMAAKAAGLEVPDVAMVRLPAPDEFGEPTGVQMGLLVERFDIAHAGTMHRLFHQDMCAVLERAPDDKFRSSWEEVAHGYMSQVPRHQKLEVGEALVRRAAVSWVLGDADAHLKNFAVLYRQSGGSGLGALTFDHVSVAPTYDVTSSIMFMPSPRMGLPLQSKIKDITLHDLASLGTLCGVSLKKSLEAAEAASICAVSAVRSIGEALRGAEVEGEPDAALRAGFPMVRRIGDLGETRLTEMAIHPGQLPDVRDIFDPVLRAGAPAAGAAGRPRPSPDFPSLTL